MALISVLEDIIHTSLTLNIGIQSIQNRLWKNGRTRFAAFAIDCMQIADRSIQVLYLQGCNFRDSKATADYLLLRGYRSDVVCR